MLLLILAAAAWFALSRARSPPPCATVFCERMTEADPEEKDLTIKALLMAFTEGKKVMQLYRWCRRELPDYCAAGGMRDVETCDKISLMCSSFEPNY